MSRVQQLLLVFFSLALLYLVYYILFLQNKPVTKVETKPVITKPIKKTNPKKQQEAVTVESLADCITSSKCSPAECKHLPQECEPKKTKTTKEDPITKAITKSLEPIIKYTGEDLREAIQIQIERNRKAFREAYRKHQNTELFSPIEKIDVEFINYGFRYVLNNFYLYLPMIAFGLSMGILGLAMSLKIFALFVIAAIISAAITQETIIGHYNYIGPYALLFSGIAVVLYDEQKSYALPILGALIGMFFGFIIASDSPIGDKWVFVTGALIAAAVISMLFSACALLFDKKWLDVVMSLLGGALILTSLMLFALEVNGRA